MIRFDRLNKLADYLEVLPAEKFDFARFWCGTKGCALGWCPTLWPRKWRFDEYDSPVITGHDSVGDSAKIFFGIDGYAALDLFFPHNELDESATPLQVSQNIRSFISKMK